MKRNVLISLMMTIVLLSCKKEEITKTLTININPLVAGSVIKSPDKTDYKINTVVNLSAKSNLGYFFSNWSGDESGLLNPISITMDVDKIIDVNFEEGELEDFNDGVADYFITDGTGRYNVTNNAYIMTGNNSNSTSYSYLPYNFNDFGISVDLKVNKSSTDSHAFGIYFRSQSGDYKINSYRLSIMIDGTWYFGKYVNSTFSFITGGWIESSALYKGLNSANNIKILFEGTQTKIYFNDVYQGYVYNLTQFVSGYVGFLGFDDENYDNEFSFDNLKIITAGIDDLRPSTQRTHTDYDLTKIKGIEKDEDGN